MALSDLMERLAAFEPTDLPVISLYLNAQPDERGRDNYGAFVRKEFGERARTFEPHTPQRESFDRDTERITSYLEKEVRPSANGIAIFACAGTSDFFEAAQLDAPIERNRLFIYNQPHLYPLARLMDQYPRYGVLLADTNSARIFVFGRGRTVETEEVKSVKTKRSQAGGWSQMRYQRHLENYHLHHAKEVIDTLDRIVREDGIEQIILAGDETKIIPLLREQMPKQLADKVIDVLNLNINTPEHEVLEETMNALRAHEAEADAEKVKRLIDDYRAGGLAVVGVEDTLAALNNGQVEELFLNASMRGIRYNELEVLQVMEAYAPATAAAPDSSEKRIVVDDLIKAAQQVSSARITFIEDESLLAKFGGVGASLRYRI